MDDDVATLVPLHDLASRGPSAPNQTDEHMAITQYIPCIYFVCFTQPEWSDKCSVFCSINCSCFTFAVILSEIVRFHKVFTDKKVSIEDITAPQKRHY